MVICLRLEIDDAFESDLKTLDYIAYQGTFASSSFAPCSVTPLFAAPFYEITESPPASANTKDLQTVKVASAGQREARELVVETYMFDSKYLIRRRYSSIDFVLSR